MSGNERFQTSKLSVVADYGPSMMILDDNESSVVKNADYSDDVSITGVDNVSAASNGFEVTPEGDHFDCIKVVNNGVGEDNGLRCSSEEDMGFK